MVVSGRAVLVPLLTAAVVALAARQVVRLLFGRRRKRGILVRDPARRPSRRDSNARAKWDEPTIAVHMKERGVLYGTMKIDHPDTPYLYYDKENDEAFEHVKGELPKTVDITELQDRLGVLHLAQEAGAPSTPQASALSQGQDRVSDFEARRRAHYTAERTGGERKGGAR
jgi:hypothetical protein